MTPTPPNQPAPNQPVYTDFFLLPEQGPPRWFQSPVPIPWTEARDRLLAARIMDPDGAGRRGVPGGWMLSVAHRDLDLWKHNRQIPERIPDPIPTTPRTSGAPMPTDNTRVILTPDAALTIEQLNTATERLNKELEEFVAALPHFRVDARIPLQGNRSVQKELIYVYNPQKGVFIESTPIGMPQGTRVPLLNASRADRVQAAFKLGDLLRTLQEVTANRLDVLAEAVDRMATLNRELKWISTPDPKE